MERQVRAIAYTILAALFVGAFYVIWETWNYEKITPRECVQEGPAHH